MLTHLWDKAKTVRSVLIIKGTHQEREKAGLNISVSQQFRTGEDANIKSLTSHHVGLRCA